MLTGAEGLIQCVVTVLELESERWCECGLLEPKIKDSDL